MKKLLKYSFPILLFGIVASVAYAGLSETMLDKLSITGNEVGFEYRDLREVIARMINGLLGFLGILFTILIIYGGWTWMTAAGNEEQVSKAKKILGQSTIGLIIVIVAYAISTFVFMVIRGAVS